MGEKLAVRSPSAIDFAESVRDCVTLRAAPPAVISAASVFLLTGSPLVSVLAVGLTTYLGSVWSRLLKPE
jgi:hypothetical protein